MALLPAKLVYPKVIYGKLIYPKVIYGKLIYPKVIYLNPKLNFSRNSFRQNRFTRKSGH